MMRSKFCSVMVSYLREEHRCVQTLHRELPGKHKHDHTTRHQRQSHRRQAREPGTESCVRMGGTHNALRWRSTRASSRSSRWWVCKDASNCSNDLSLYAVAIAFIAFILIPDEVALSHALRGRGDTVLPVLTHFISYLFVMIPLSWLLALRLERGAEGILEAILIASVVAAALLIWRFYYLAKRGRVA